MTEHDKDEQLNDAADASDAGTQTAPQPTKAPPSTMPQYKVLLHNDDTSEMGDVVDSIVMLTPLNKQDATQRMLEADQTGVALLLVTHKERAELYQEQFASRNLTVTIEPAE